MIKYKSSDIDKSTIGNGCPFLCQNYINQLASSRCGCKPQCVVLTHWGRVTHICVSRLTITGSDNGLSPGQRQAIIWTNAGILLIGTLGTNFSDISIKIYIFSFKKMHLKMSSGKWRPCCLGLNVLKHISMGVSCKMAQRRMPQRCNWCRHNGCNFVDSIFY